MINQVLFLLGLYTLGVLTGLLFKKHIPVVFICLTGFLWGSLIWVIAGVSFLIVSMPYSALNMLLLAITILIALTIIHIRRGTWRLTRSEITWFVGVMLAFAIVVSVATQYNFSVASYDSIAQIMLGRNIANHGFTESVTRELASWGVFLPLLQSASVFLGDGYLYAAQPAFAFTLLLTFFYLSQRAARQSFSEVRVALALALLATLALASTYFMVFQAFYIHNGLIAATYLFVAIVTFWLALCERNNVWLIFAILALTGYSISRTEAPLFALIFLALVVSTGQISYRVRLAFSLPYLIILVLWYLYLLRIMGAGTDILDPKKTLVIIGSLTAFCILIGLSYYRWVERYFLPILHIFMLGVLLLILMVMFILKPEDMQISMTAIWQNMIINGRWGATWLILLGLLVFGLIQPRFSYERLFSYGIPLFFALLLALGFMRAPYRLGWGDSANRIITHIIPIIFLYTLLKYGHGMHASIADIMYFMRKRRFGMLAISGGVFFLVILFWFIQPMDYAIGAAVIEAPVFSSADRTGPHDFSVALRGKVDNLYVAARNPGPAMVILDLGREVRASFLEMTEYHPDLALVDYAWDVSRDGLNWITVFDTQSPTNSRRQIVNDVTSRFWLADSGNFRFLRLTFRSGKDQNRLLLRRIAVYSNIPGARMLNQYLSPPVPSQ